MGAGTGTGSWPWRSHEERVQSARRALVSRGEPGHSEAAARFRAAWTAAWPPGFPEDLQRCRRGEAEGLEPVLGFAEACPHFYRTGYMLQDAIHWLGRPPRTLFQAHRSRALVVAAVERRLHLPFRYVPVLAGALDSPELREALQRCLLIVDPQVQVRALQVLDRLPGEPWDPERARQRSHANRLRSQVIQGQQRRSLPLLRKVLSADVRAVGSEGRHLMAVAFEFAMNWGLLPDEELLEVVRRLDGPEMDSIWRFAFQRLDTPGQRARWLWSQLGKSESAVVARIGTQVGLRAPVGWYPSPDSSED